jgi:hypothetical protein
VQMAFIVRQSLSNIFFKVFFLIYNRQMKLKANQHIDC